MSPSEMIQEWHNGCSCAGPLVGLPPGHPEQCLECTRALIDTLEKKLEGVREQMDVEEACDLVWGLICQNLARDDHWHKDVTTDYVEKDATSGTDNAIDFLLEHGWATEKRLYDFTGIRSMGTVILLTPKIGEDDAAPY